MESRRRRGHSVETRRGDATRIVRGDETCAATRIFGRNRYDRTQWSAGGRAVAAAPPGPAYAAAIAAAVGLLASDGSMVEKAVEEFAGLDFSGLERAYAGAGALGKLVPPECLKHRVADWLDKGCAQTNDRLWRLRRRGRACPVVVYAGADDRFLPSKSEADRLKKAVAAETYRPRRPRLVFGRSRRRRGLRRE